MTWQILCWSITPPISYVLISGMPTRECQLLITLCLKLVHNVLDDDIALFIGTFDSLLLSSSHCFAPLYFYCCLFFVFTWEASFITCASWSISISKLMAELLDNNMILLQRARCCSFWRLKLVRTLTIVVEGDSIRSGPSALISSDSVLVYPSLRVW